MQLRKKRGSVFPESARMKQQLRNVSLPRSMAVVFTRAQVNGKNLAGWTAGLSTGRAQEMQKRYCRQVLLLSCLQTGFVDLRYSFFTRWLPRCAECRHRCRIFFVMFYSVLRFYCSRKRIAIAPPSISCTGAEEFSSDRIHGETSKGKAEQSQSLGTEGQRQGPCSGSP